MIRPTPILLISLLVVRADDDNIRGGRRALRKAPTQESELGRSRQAVHALTRDPVTLAPSPFRTESQTAHLILESAELPLITGQLWMESTAKEDRLVVDGIPIGHGSVFPLTHGLTLGCGELEGH